MKKHLSLEDRIKALAEDSSVKNKVSKGSVSDVVGNQPSVNHLSQSNQSVSGICSISNAVWWSLIQGYIPKSDIKICGNQIYIKGKIHGHADGPGFRPASALSNSNSSASANSAISMHGYPDFD